MKCIKGFAVALVLLGHAGLASASVGLYLADTFYSRDSRCTDTCSENGFSEILGMCISIDGTTYEAGTLELICDETTDSCCSVPALDAFGNPVAAFAPDYLCLCRDTSDDFLTSDCVTDCPIGTVPFAALDPLGVVCQIEDALETSYGLVSDLDGSCIFVSSAGLFLEVADTYAYNCLCMSDVLFGQTVYINNVFGSLFSPAGATPEPTVASTLIKSPSASPPPFITTPAAIAGASPSPVVPAVVAQASPPPVVQQAAVVAPASAPVQLISRAGALAPVPVGAPLHGLPLLAPSIGATGTPSQAQKQSSTASAPSASKLPPGLAG